MPIYAYRCSTCGHAKDVLQKMSDPLLTTCPACGEATFVKQVTAAGFQLKGSGWYVTDFRGDSSGKPDASKSDAPKSTETKTDTTAAAVPAPAKSDAAPAPAPAPAASATPAAPAPSSK